MKNAEIIAKLNLEQKCALLSGAGTFTTRGCPKAGVPSITLSDGPNGVRKQAGAADHLGLNPSVPATCFPTAATVACSWDPALGEEIGRAMGEEAAAQEVAVLLGPGLNTKRSPLCGRNFEYFSEDPYLSGKMAAAYVRGIQSEGIAACPKHFAVNSQELRRMASDSVLDERTLRELYLTGFEIVVKEAAPKTIMSSYNLVNGTYANENAHLLQDILRRDWGFSGAVVTDWGGSNDHALGVKNGSTLEMPAPGGDAVRELLAAVQSGKITEADVDARLDELLTLVLDTSAAVQKHNRSFDADAHHALARRAAAESAVLLKNDGGILPLAAGARVAVIGDFAETPRYQGAGSSAVNSIKVDTLLDCLAQSGLQCAGFAAGFDRQGRPDADKKAQAVALAQKADTVLLCLGLDEIKESGTINIGVFSDKNPFGYVDENGEYQGYDVYYARRLGEDLGVDVNFVSTEAANRIEYLQTGKVDVILANFTVTPERAEEVDFASPYMNVSLGVVSKDDNVITSLDNWNADDSIIVISGTTAETYLIANYPDIPLQKFDSYATAKEAFENGTSVAWANDNTEVIAFALQNEGYTVGIPSLGSADTIAPAVSKGNTTLLDWINDEIVALGEENFFHADYEATLADTYGLDYEDSLVVEGGKVNAQ